MDERPTWSPGGALAFNVWGVTGVVTYVSEMVQPRPQAVEGPEELLLARARGGDTGALDALVRRHLGEVYAVAARILGDGDLAQDAAQDALVSALTGLDRFRSEGSFRKWLLRIAVNAAVSLGRREWRRREVSLAFAEDLPVRDPDPASRAAARCEAERVRRAVAALPERQRLAVVLRVYHGLSHREVAEVLGCSEGAARVNYHLGIKRLRELLTCTS